MQKLYRCAIIDDKCHGDTVAGSIWLNKQFLASNCSSITPLASISYRYRSTAFFPLLLYSYSAHSVNMLKSPIIVREELPRLIYYAGDRPSGPGGSAAARPSSGPMPTCASGNAATGEKEGVLADCPPDRPVVPEPAKTVERKAHYRSRTSRTSPLFVHRSEGSGTRQVRPGFAKTETLWACSFGRSSRMSSTTHSLRQRGDLYNSALYADVKVRKTGLGIGIQYVPFSIGL